MGFPNLGFESICQKTCLKPFLWPTAKVADIWVTMSSLYQLHSCSVKKTVKIGKLFGLVEPKTCQKCPELGTLPVLIL